MWAVFLEMHFYFALLMRRATVSRSGYKKDLRFRGTRQCELNALTLKRCFPLEKKPTFGGGAMAWRANANGNRAVTPTRGAAAARAKPTMAAIAEVNPVDGHVPDDSLMHVVVVGKPTD
jgi:hypothetical protein